LHSFLLGYSKKYSKVVKQGYFIPIKSSNLSFCSLWPVLPVRAGSFKWLGSGSSPGNFGRIDTLPQGLSGRDLSRVLEPGYIALYYSESQFGKGHAYHSDNRKHLVNKKGHAYHSDNRKHLVNKNTSRRNLVLLLVLYYF